MVEQMLPQPMVQQILAEVEVGVERVGLMEETEDLVL